MVIETNLLDQILFFPAGTCNSGQCAMNFDTYETMDFNCIGTPDGMWGVAFG